MAVCEHVAGYIGASSACYNTIVSSPSALANCGVTSSGSYQSCSMGRQVEAYVFNRFQVIPSLSVTVLCNIQPQMHLQSSSPHRELLQQQKRYPGRDYSKSTQYLCFCRSHGSPTGTIYSCENTNFT